MIAGRTFPNQKVPAVSHGAIFEAALSDGVLKGCTLSYTGSKLTIGTGLFIEAGRGVEIVAAETLTVTQLNGYARVKAVVNTAAESTANNFSQFLWGIEYAASPTGFPSLTQENINGSGGNIYEMEFCVLSLGSGGITGIVKQPLSGGVGKKNLAGDVTAKALGGATLGADGKVRPEQASSDVVEKSASFTLELSLAGKMVLAGSSSPTTVTIPINASVPFPKGTEIEIVQWGTGVVTIQGASGTSMGSLDNSRTITGRFGCVTLKKIDTDTWLLAGALG